MLLDVSEAPRRSRPHTFLWFIESDSRIGPTALHEILEPGNQRLLSIASLWEIAIKASIGKLKQHSSFEQLVQVQVLGNAIDLLPISERHLDVVQVLPLHHRDPFDRLLVAQALSENLVLLSRDRSLSDYGARVLW